MPHRKKPSGLLSRFFLHMKLWMCKYRFYYTTAPDGRKYLSILQFGPRGLASRRVFAVTDELDSTPVIPGSKTICILRRSVEP